MIRSPRKLLPMMLVLAILPAAAAGSVLDRIAETGEFRIGFATGSPPLSYVDAEGKAVGYSIDLCRHVASRIRVELGLEQLKIKYVPLVAMEDRLAAVQNGDVDIECGATTVTLSRRERVDFTLMTFITGSAVLSRKADPIDNVDQLAGKRIAVMTGTTTEDVLREFRDVNGVDMKIRSIETHDEGMKLLNERRVDGYASDRAMLIGLVLSGENASKEYTMTRGALSFEPYAMMVPRGDTRFRLSADRALADLYRSARIRGIYHKWFGRYGEPLSPIVEAMYQFQAVGE